MLTLPFPITGIMLQAARPLLQAGNVSLAAAVAPAWTVIAVETLPGGERGFITSVGVEVDANGTGDYDFSTGSIAFRLTLNQASPVEWEAWTAKRGNILFPTPTIIRVEPGTLVMLQARRIVAEADARTVVGMFNGFRYPTTIQKTGNNPLAACLSPEVSRLIPS